MDDINWVHKQQTALDIECIRVEEKAEMDQLRALAWDRLEDAGDEGPDPRWASTIIAARKREAEAIGLDTPTKQAVTVQSATPSDVDEETIETIEVVTRDEAEQLRGKRWLRIPQNGNGHAKPDDSENP